MAGEQRSTGTRVQVVLSYGHPAGDYLPHDVAEGQVGRLLRMVDEDVALVQFPQGLRFIYRAFLVRQRPVRPVKQHV